jgi:hypothetical protein
MFYKDEIENYIEQSNSVNTGKNVLKSLQQFSAVMNDDRYVVRWERYEWLIKFFGLFKLFFLRLSFFVYFCSHKSLKI